MGDQAGVSVSGTLAYVPEQEIKRLLALPLDANDKARLFAAVCRINTFYMIACAGSGHIGSSFSSLDVMSWLQLNVINPVSGAKPGESKALFFSSKGHDAPALYCTMIGLGLLEFDLLHRLRQLDGLPGHPDVSTPGIVTNTGSLGMGISKAKGMILASRLQGESLPVVVMTGDGELQEGQIWESLGSAANRGLGELTVVVDHNKLQSDTLVSEVSDLGDLEAKFAAFGWHVSRCDGNDIDAFAATWEKAQQVPAQPKVIIADTVKGKGVSFMEHTSIDSDVELYKYHSGAPSSDDYALGLGELVDNANTQLAALDADPLQLHTVTRPEAVAPANPQRLIAAYSDELLSIASNNEDLVALDADLILDTGLIPFKEQFPARFIECGIAEQDMVSQAGGLALRGKLPVVHSFACFLTSRANEHMYNNATEATRIIYAGSLAGVLPGGPGHSHQAVRDICTMKAIPGMTLIAPGTEAETKLALRWAEAENPGSTYLRLESLPTELPEMPQPDSLVEGQGNLVADGEDVAIITYGPTLLKEAMASREVLLERGIGCRVISMPWLNRLDSAWLASVLADVSLLVMVDNHYLEGGQGEFIAARILGENLFQGRVLRLGLNEVPACGRNPEVLSAHGLDGESIATSISSLMQS